MTCVYACHIDGTLSIMQAAKLYAHLHERVSAMRICPRRAYAREVSSQLEHRSTSDMCTRFQQINKC